MQYISEYTCYIYISAKARIINQPAGSQAVERRNPEKLPGETQVLGETCCWSDNSIDEIFYKSSLGNSKYNVYNKKPNIWRYYC